MLFKKLISILSLYSLVTLSVCHEQPNPLTGDHGVPAHDHNLNRDTHAQEQYGRHPSDNEPGILFDDKIMHDRNHIKSHLEGLVKPDDNASDEEMEFYYFKLHDYDKDDHLDGLELLKAFLHEHKHHGEDQASALDPLGSINQIITTVDQLLQQHDRNLDGKLDYREYHRLSGDGR